LRRNWLKSDLRFLGTDTPSVRIEARRWRTAHKKWDVEAVPELTEALWRREVFELRSFALMLLVERAADLEPRHLGVLERLLRDSHTWALVDEIAPRLVGPLLERHPREAGRIVDRWARDHDFWIRREATRKLPARAQQRLRASRDRAAPVLATDDADYADSGTVSWSDVLAHL